MNQKINRNRKTNYRTIRDNFFYILFVFCTMIGIIGLAILVFITDIAIKVPKKYEPLSPRKRVALGKLYIRKIITIRIPHNIKRAKSLFPLK